MAQIRVSKERAKTSNNDEETSVDNEDTRRHTAAVAGQAATAEQLSNETDAVVDAIDEVTEKSPLDELLDEIDKVLYPNAEKFVEEYVQKGGQ